MKLIIIESASKKKTLSKYLAEIFGDDPFKVVASLGHIRDLPQKDLGVDVSNGFQPVYVAANGKSKTIRMLAKHVQDADTIYLATDPDREGEAIAWHILQVTRPKTPIYRVTFNEITQPAVAQAFANLRQLDMDLVAAQEARRILDRLVGYSVSPALWRGLDERGLSAGRVQSVALQLVVERQQAIDSFETRDYWCIVGQFGVPLGEFQATLVMWQGQPWATETFRTKELADAAITELANMLMRVHKVEVKDRRRKPPKPFITSTLQQAASTHLKLSPDKTMSIAQRLYEAGHITYHRTDNPAVSAEAAANAAAVIREQYGDVYVPDKPRAYQASSGAQEAHECIRPTDIARQDLDVPEDGLAARLYGLIWQRFVASQMVDALHEQTRVFVTGGPAVFMAQSSVLTFDGFLRVYTYGDDLEQEGTPDAAAIVLPPVVQHQVCQTRSLQPEQHVTRPPHTYSEAALVNALERLGVGRPSTYSLVVATIRHRKYVILKQRRLRPTALGQRVVGFLQEHFALVMDYTFTKTMEDALDKIATGQLDTRKFLRVFWNNFEPLVKPWAHAAPYQAQPIQTGESCPVCAQGQMVIKSSKKGRFLSCNRYPQCKYSRDIKAAKPVLIGRKCPNCQAELCVRSRRGTAEKFIGCLGYPDCLYTEALTNEPV